MSCCLFIPFFSLMHFLKLLLRSFSRCFSSLDMLLLSPMRDRISASLSRHSSFFLLLQTWSRELLCCRSRRRSRFCCSGTRQNLPLRLDVELVHRDVLLNCVQDAHHQVGVISAVASLPASRNCHCSHFLHRFRVHCLRLRFSRAGVGVVSAVAPLQSCLFHCISFHHHFHGL